MFFWFCGQQHPFANASRLFTYYIDNAKDFPNSAGDCLNSKEDCHTISSIQFTFHQEYKLRHIIFFSPSMSKFSTRLSRTISQCLRTIFIQWQTVHTLWTSFLFSGHVFFCPDKIDWVLWCSYTDAAQSENHNAASTAKIAFNTNRKKTKNKRKRNHTHNKEHLLIRRLQIAMYMFFTPEDDLLVQRKCT